MFYPLLLPMDKMILNEADPKSVDEMGYLKRFLLKVFGKSNSNEQRDHISELGSGSNMKSKSDSFSSKIETDKGNPASHKIIPDRLQLPERRRKSFEALKAFIPPLRRSSSKEFGTIEFNATASFLFEEDYLSEAVRVMVSLSGTIGYLSILASNTARAYKHDSSYNTVMHKFSIDKEVLVIVPIVNDHNSFVVRIKLASDHRISPISHVNPHNN